MNFGANAYTALAVRPGFTTINSLSTHNNPMSLVSEEKIEAQRG